MSKALSIQKAMNLAELWKVHSEAKFPLGYGGRDVNRICITSLDSYAAGCISSYLHHGEKNIGLERIQKIKNCRDELATVLPHLDGYAIDYFNRLHQMCSLIVAEESNA